MALSPCQMTMTARRCPAAPAGDVTPLLGAVLTLMLGYRRLRNYTLKRKIPDFRTVHSAFYFPHSAFYRDPTNSITCGSHFRQLAINVA